MKKDATVAKKVMDLIVNNGLVGVCVLMDPNDPSGEALVTANMSSGKIKALFKELSENPMEEQGKFTAGNKVPHLKIKKNNLPS